MHVYRHTLNKLPLLSGLPEACLTAMALKLEARSMAPGEVIYREGEVGDCLFFLCEGSVELSMLMMTNKARDALGAHPVHDPAVKDWFLSGLDKNGKNTMLPDQCEGTVSL